MKLLIVSPLHHSHAGGPAQYAVQLSKALARTGNEAEVVAFSPFMKYWSGVRHVLFFFFLIKKMRRFEAVIILDTFTVALPSVCAGRLLGKKVLIRTGGDFLWEQYVERTKEQVLLSEFYGVPRRLGIKGRLSFLIQKYIVFPCANVLVFSTEWQRALWHVPYHLSKRNTRVIENAYAHTLQGEKDAVRSKNIAWIGRDIVLKNVALLRKAVIEVQKKYPECTVEEYTSVSHNEVTHILQMCRALIIPSLSEVSPNLALEALSLGTPVIVTNDCGLRGVLGDAVTWIDARSVNSIASALEDALSSDTYETMKQRAQSFVASRTYGDVAEDCMRALTYHENT